MRRLLPCIAIVFALAGCTAQPAEPAVTVTVTPEAEATPTPTPTPTSTMRLTTNGAPYRADMDETTRVYAEAEFINAVNTHIPETASFTDASLLGAGSAFCDSMDRGDSLQAGFIVVAGLLPNLPSTDAVAYLSSDASLWLCPEHAPGATG